MEARTEGLPHEMWPSRFVARVDRLSGDEVDEELTPEALLVSAHRGRHPVDITGRAVASAIVRRTGDEERAYRVMRRARWLGRRASGSVARAIPGVDDATLARRLFGLRDSSTSLEFRSPDAEGHFEQRAEALRADAAAAHTACADEIRPLLTGGTGFVGKSILLAVVEDPRITELTVVIRPKTIRDRQTGEVLEVISPAERGRALLDELGLTADADRFRFVAGDIELPALGLEAAEQARASTMTTHVIHCAASVNFDDPYPTSFDANVRGSQNALEFSAGLQAQSGSPFVAHLGIETSFIHGRQVARSGAEDRLVFPHDSYNNHYEFTKAVASLETERFMAERGLRVIQLCPAIVIGDSTTGNNRGDTKVVNAPVNAFGRAGAAKRDASGLAERLQTTAIEAAACAFPADQTARLGIISVDRVAEGIVAALHHPSAVGRRVHLAHPLQLRASELLRIAGEELDVHIRLVDPTLHRVLLRPVLKAMLAAAGQQRLGEALERLGSVFGGYSEWGQPIHAVGHDVDLLGLEPIPLTPNQMFRMLCRHNKWVQEFGALRDPLELRAREQRWSSFLDEVKSEIGIAPWDLDAQTFAGLANERYRAAG